MPTDKLKLRNRISVIINQIMVIYHPSGIW